MRQAREYLIATEWSRGTGQCPSCGGTSSSCYGVGVYEPQKIGHHERCAHADALRAVGGNPLRRGEFDPPHFYRRKENSPFGYEKVSVQQERAIRRAEEILQAAKGGRALVSAWSRGRSFSGEFDGTVTFSYMDEGAHKNTDS